MNIARVLIGWQLPTHVCQSFTRQIRVYTKKLVKKLARIEASSICRQQFANVFADCFYAVHTHQLEFANTRFANFSLPCEGRFRVRGISIVIPIDF